MEKIGSLIEKLNAQFSEKVSLEQLLSTAQLLQNEIAGSIKEVDMLGTKGISVIVPNAKPLPGTSVFKEAEKEYFELITDDDNEDNATESGTEGIPSYEELMKLQSEIKKYNQPQAILNLTEVQEDAEETPTLARQGKSAAKATKQIYSSKVNKNAVKDLHKAINTQDRALFIRELFRGDEIMFERSIKTINNFNSLAQAEYWMRRELKTKIGWLAGNSTVQQFEQLVKKRFT